jgi:2-(1,2-epoxy-1,2-dihydrophenyl)acetyl-CoA isomerase
VADIELEADGPVRYIWLSRPDRLNALSDEIRKGLISILDEVEADPEARVAVISGRGRAFCAGGDVQGQSERLGTSLSIGARIARHRRSGLVTAMRILEFGKPIVAAVNGPAVGAGFHLALACDMRIASTSAYFSEVFIDRGLVPDWLGLRLLPEMIGISRATELVLTGRRMPAKEACDIGVVSRVIDDAEFPAAMRELAESLAERPPLAISLAKQLMKSAMMSDIWATRETEAIAQAICGTSEDHAEGVAAFLEKRPAKFRGV